VKNKKINGYAKWISIGIVVFVIAYNTISNVVTRENDIKHILKTQDEIIERIERIENYLWVK
jgi:hypothetical protein